MEPKVTKHTDTRVYLRKRAWELHKEGMKQKDIAHVLGKSPGSICEWLKRAKQEEGEKAFQPKKPKGGTRKISYQKLRPYLDQLLKKSPRDCGFSQGAWTLPLITRMIERRFGVKYNQFHVGKLLKKWGFSPQKPQKRSVKRDEEKITHWKEEWKKKA